MGSEVYHTLKKIIGKKYGTSNISVGDEGGFAPSINSEKETLELLVKAINESGYEDKVKIGLDVAASEFWREDLQKYDLSFKWENGKTHHLTTEELIDQYKNLVDNYPIISIEDPLQENDFEGWSLMQKKLGDKILIVGDDLLVTNPSRIRMALKP